jgi:hypothetical protein
MQAPRVNDSVHPIKRAVPGILARRFSTSSIGGNGDDSPGYLEPQERFQPFVLLPADLAKLEIRLRSSGLVRCFGENFRSAVARGNRLLGWVVLQKGDVVVVKFWGLVEHEIVFIGTLWTSKEIDSVALSIQLTSRLSLREPH